MHRLTIALLLVIAATMMSPSAPARPTSLKKNVIRKTVPTKKPATTKTTPAILTKTPVPMSEPESRLVAAVNEYRRKHNLPPMTPDPILMAEARRSAPHFSHCIRGQWCWHRCKRAGYPGWASDDIASGYESPEDAVQGWATSDGHARQMRGFFKMNGRWENYNFNEIGVGISGKKYIAIFGRKETRNH